jgi:S-adenosylmethionine decarboxylase proenzyme
MNSEFSDFPLSRDVIAEPAFRSIEEVLSIELNEFNGLGQHLLVDFSGCRSISKKADELEEVMLATARAIKATIVTSSFHEFNPQGLSGVVVIAESHLAVHTWPEHGAVCVDLFTCSSDMDAVAGLALMFETFDASTMQIQTVSRGQSPSGKTLNGDVK